MPPELLVLVGGKGKVGFFAAIEYLLQWQASKIYIGVMAPLPLCYREFKG